MNWDFIIIGSGFGGSITACRLAQKGQRVLVLERGRRWVQKDYPIREPWIYDPDEPAKRNGWIDFRAFGRMNVVQGAGIGGGSLIYANISVEARPELFEKPWGGQISYENLKPYYDRVAKFMNVQRVPENQVPARYELMKRAAAAKGWGERFGPVELCVEFDPDFDMNNYSPNDEAGAFSKKYKNQHGIDVGTCVHCGNCDIGCRHDAKSTLDKNYIPVAEKHGAEFRALHVVRMIEPSNGGYAVHFDRIENKTLIRGKESAKQVIVACGSLGSTELLLRCRDEFKTLPNISRRLGRNWTSNGDFLTLAKYEDFEPLPHKGPTITSIIDFLDGAYNGQKFWVQDGGYPNVLVNYLRRFDKKFAKAVAKAVENELDRNVMPWFAQGIDAGDGRLYLGRPWWWPFGGQRLTLDWNVKTNEPLFTAIADMHTELSEATGGKPLELGTFLWKRLKTLVTPHPLGGCNMGTSAQDGVVDYRGEVFDHKGLYVIDGAIIPKPIGRNPTRTIAALAELVVEKM
jgi:cholesterol oxidase